MKISIIIPVYNGEETIENCLASLLEQDYPNENYEIIVINDGSTDGTADIVKKFLPRVKLVTLQENCGRIVARQAGVCAASNGMLFFIDSRITAEPDVLKRAAEIGYQPLSGGDWNDEYLKYKSTFETLFYLLRRKAYPDYFPQYKHYDKTPFFMITEENFDEAPKGMTCLLIDKELFVASQPQEKGKYVSDDTRILNEVVKKKAIMRHIGVKFYYEQRKRFWEVMKHIYERGPRFADYYLKKGGKYRGTYMLTLLTLAVMVAMVVLKPELLSMGIAILLALYLASALWLAESFRDFVIVSFCLFPVVAAFLIGVLRGMMFAKVKGS